MQMPKVYFPGLDALRAIAVLLVFAGHFGTVMSYWGLDLNFVCLSGLAGAGLILFFVLSGFLITYLLLLEQVDYRKINVPNFYIRRMLRIWPLYYLIVGIGQFLIPSTGLLGLEKIDQAILANFHQQSLWYLLFLPNIAFLSNPVNFYIGHTWSIGVEEQFYLIWPWVLKKCGKHLYSILWALILLALLSSWSYQYWFPGLNDKGKGLHWLSKINAAFYWSNIGYFALGGLMAFCKLMRPRLEIFLSRPTVQIASLLLSCCILIGPKFPLEEFLLAILFAVLVLNASQAGTLLYRLQHPILLYLGKISYGMYIFHILAIIVSSELLLKTGAQHLPQPVFGALSFSLALGMTFLAGTISYSFVESFFLRLKARFRTINTSPRKGPSN